MTDNQKNCPYCHNHEDMIYGYPYDNCQFDTRDSNGRYMDGLAAGLIDDNGTFHIQAECSDDDGWFDEEDIHFNYCPMCGRKLAY